MSFVFRTRHFSRWMRKTELADAILCAAVREKEARLVDADLGGGVVRKRIAGLGRGKRGNARTLVATNRLGRWFFLCGFEKNDRADVSESAGSAVRTLRRLGPRVVRSAQRTLPAHAARHCH